ncbi:hypothetical protein [Geobacter sp. OR-1]|uniref:hypothetical protein n=1 Tax=Geobacter sp. OR-1 TaxID=1266765 RepID=UPI0006940FF4|nr:hypothetical protein [Geobacter sp. OR-1]
MKPGSLIVVALLLLSLTATSYGSPVPSDQPEYGVISGKVLINGKTPLPNGVVLLYDKLMGPPPDPYKYWRIPDLISPLDKDGSFSIGVTEGTFYLMVAQKNPRRRDRAADRERIPLFSRGCEG